MSKPEDIPQDIWDSAYETLHPLVREQYEISPFSQVQHYGIARAILAERERCSKIAGSELRNTSMLMSNPPKSGAAWDIRNAIDAGTPAP